MKKSLSLLTLSLPFIFCLQSADARDLTYRLGVGYQEMSQSVRDKAATDSTLVQLHGLSVSYGIAQDMHAGVWFGFANNFDTAAVGPYFRYDLQRMFNRDTVVWNYLNIYLQVAFLGKMGAEQKKGITLHLPTLGFEILPFERNNFAIGTSAGVVIDFVDKNKISFTQGQFGDVNVKYYF